MYFKGRFWIPKKGDTKVSGDLEKGGRDITDHDIVLLVRKSDGNIVDIHISWQKSENFSMASSSNLESNSSGANSIWVVVVAEFILYPNVKWCFAAGMDGGPRLLDKYILALTGVIKLVTIKRCEMRASGDDATAETFGRLTGPLAASHASAFFTLGSVDGPNGVSHTILAPVTVFTVTNGHFNLWQRSLYGSMCHSNSTRGACETGGTLTLIGGNTFTSIHTWVRAHGLIAKSPCVSRIAYAHGRSGGLDNASSSVVACSSAVDCFAVSSRESRLAFTSSTETVRIFTTWWVAGVVYVGL